MAVHDHERRTPRDYIHNARFRYDDAGWGMKWVGLFIGLAVLALIGYMLFATPNTDTMLDSTPQTPQTTTAPTTQPTAPARK